MKIFDSKANSFRSYLESLCTTSMSLYGAAWLRIGYGIAGVAYYIVNYGDRGYLWGPDGVYPFGTFKDSIIRPAFSIYEVSESRAIFEGLFHLGLVVALLFGLGIGGRAMTAVHYIFLVSLYMRNPALLDGGDNLAYLVLLYLIPVNTTSVLAVRSRIPAPAAPRLSTLLHNVGLMFIGAQLCFVYLASGMYKIQGQYWRDGTALYYILRVPEFSWPIVTDYLVKLSWFITFATYATVFFQLLFPALIIRRETRALAVLCGVIFHLSIALLMGLTTFSLYIIATETIFLSDYHYKKAKSRAQSVIRRASPKKLLESLTAWIKS